MRGSIVGPSPEHRRDRHTRVGRRNLVVAVVAFGLLSAAPLAASPAIPAYWPAVRSSSGTTIPVAPGIWYSHYILGTSSGPLSIHHLKLDIRNPAVRLTVGLARNQLISGDETVSSMVRRTGAIAGVNADFFDIGESGMPLNIMVQDERLLRSPSGWVAMAIGKDGGVRFVRYRWTGNVIFPATGTAYWLAGLNTGLVPDGIIAMSNIRGYGAPLPGPGVRQMVVELVPASGPDQAKGAGVSSSTAATAPAPSTLRPAAPADPTALTATEAGRQTPPAAPSAADAPPSADAPAGTAPLRDADADNTRDADHAGDASQAPAPAGPVSSDDAAPQAPAPAPAPAAPAPPPSDAPAPPANYQVKGLWPQQAYYAPFPKGTILLVARGKAADWILHNVAPGTPVQLNLTTLPDWRDSTHIVGGGPLLVAKGRVVVDPLSPVPGERYRRNPVTAVGVSRDGGTMLLVAVDGRQPRLSIGLTQPQLAYYMRWLGAFDAMEFDSGGSVTMTVRFPWRPWPAVVNSPSDGHERPVGNALLVLSNPLNAQKNPPH